MIFNDDLIEELVKGTDLSHALVSIYTDRFDPENPDSTGFWADSPSLGATARWGSRIRSFQRSKLNDATILDLESEFLQSVKWLLDDKLLRSVAVTVERKGTIAKATLELNGRKVRLDAI